MDSSNTYLLDEMLVNLLLMLRGIFSVVQGDGCFVGRDIRQFVIRLHVWLVAPVCDVEG